MNYHEIKKEIRSYYQFTGGKIKLNLTNKTFLYVLGDCICEVKLPPHITRQLNLKDLGI